MGVKILQGALLKADSESLGESIVFETVNAVEMLLEPPPPRTYLVEGLPLGIVGLIVGHGGYSKSTFALDVALSVASGEAVCEGLYAVHNPGEVLVVAGEDDKVEIHRRIYAIGQVKIDSTDNSQAVKHKVGKRLHIKPLCGKPASLLDDSGESTELFDALLAKANSLDNLRLVVIDPLRRFYDGEENDSGAATQMVMLLERIAKETGATVLAVHHMNKASGNSTSSYAARGSSAFTDGVRWQLNMGQPSKVTKQKLGIADDDSFRYIELWVTKNNYAPPQDKTVVLERRDHGVLVNLDLDNLETSKVDDDLVAKVVKGVNELHSKGKHPGKNEFIQNNKDKQGFGVSESELRTAVNQAIEQGLVKAVKDPKHQGKGKPAGLLIPAGISL